MMDRIFIITPVEDNTVNKVSNLIRSTIIIGGTLLGLRYDKERKRWQYSQLESAGWIFLLGLPIGLVVFGELFSIIIWALMVFIILAISNIDTVIAVIPELYKYGPDGEVIEKEEEKCQPLHSFLCI